MDLILRNGTVVTAHETMQADVGIENGKVKQIEDLFYLNIVHLYNPGITITLKCQKIKNLSQIDKNYYLNLLITIEEIHFSNKI